MSLSSPLPPGRPNLSGGDTQLSPWPTVEQMLRIKRSGKFNIGRRLKTSAMLLQARLHRPVLASAFAEMQWAAHLFQRHPLLFRALLDQYLDARQDMARRFHQVTRDLRHLHSRRQEGKLLALMDHERVTLWRDDELGLQVDFEINLHTPQEGLWRLNLHQVHDDARFIYALSFAMVQGRVFVGAMQGVKGDDGQDLVRQATKTLHGVRPHFFLIEVLRQLALTWRAAGIVGVDSAHQLKAREGSDDNHLVRFDYAAFWQELGGTRNEQGHWDVPLQGTRKDLAEVESKKRSMYRKRYAMLDALAQHVALHA